MKRLFSDGLNSSDQLFIFQPKATEMLLRNKGDNEFTATIKNNDNIVDKALDAIDQEMVLLKC